MKKTWLQKAEDKKSLPKVLKLGKGFPCYNAVHKMGVNAGEPIVLANPSEIAPIMAKVPRGKVIILPDICRQVAAKHGVRGCCSLTTGIFIMTIANAAVEAAAAGAKQGLAAIPYWRTVKADGYLNDKYPGGQEAHKRLLAREGIKVKARGKKY